MRHLESHAAWQRFCSGAEAGAICVSGRDPGAQREEAWMPSIGHAFIDMLRAESHEFPRVPLAGFSEQRAHRLSNLAFERLAAGILSLQHASLQGATGRSFTPSSRHSSTLVDRFELFECTLAHRCGNANSGK